MSFNYPQTDQEAKAWCTEALRGNPAFGKQLLSLAREIKDVKFGKSLEPHIKDLSPQNIFDNTYALCRYAANGESKKGIKATDEEKRKFYEVFNDFPSIVEAMYATRELENKDIELQKLKTNLILEAALFSAGSKLWTDALRKGNVPTDLYASLLRKTSRMKKALEGIDAHLKKQKDILTMIQSMAPSVDTSSVRQENPLFSMVESLARERNKLASDAVMSVRSRK